MNLSMKWLNDYTDIKIDAKDFAEKMTMSGSKVETYENMNDHIKNVVVGKITKIEKHPDADKLVVCQLEVGIDRELQIVTGASNVFEGAIVPVCLDGAILPSGTQIKKGKLRGVVSEGMLCSLGELGLTAHNFPDAIEDGIFIINFPCEIGQNIVDAIEMNDDVFEFEITPNRPDCLSMLGLAREVSATFNIPFKKHVPKFNEVKDDSIENYLSVTVENKELCPRYSARVVKNIKIEPSPLWLRNRLHACGVRPINNIVDITNYVMLEYGQPMHAFDYKCLDGKAIVVRNANDNEIFKTLDDQERKLDSEMLVIADANKSVAVAGVMGGANSEITDETKTIVFESANFNGANVRHTTKKLGMRTDASSRFEKRLDPCLTMPALDRACELIEMLGAGEVVSGVIDVNSDARERRVIKLDVDWINKFLGTDISKEFMVNALTMLEFNVDSELNVTVPSFRDDVEEKADLAEEIVRLYGYNEIPSTLVKMETTQGMLTEKQKLSKAINDTLIAEGASEICTYSFVSPKIYDKLHYPKDDIRRDSVIISNPLGEDTSIMRTTSAASMLATLAVNYNNRNEAV
ncbi:MAG: phenylalanine--tRNA ligase subunit beta, partial [Clostridia bacterium]|nr:phenylalanine--tRNA ligase subunit beta [Clostridia bacterium]